MLEKARTDANIAAERMAAIDEATRKEAERAISEAKGRNQRGRGPSGFGLRRPSGPASRNSWTQATREAADVLAAAREEMERAAAKAEAEVWAPLY